MSKRTRKRYTPEFKREAVSLVTEHGYSKAEAGGVWEFVEQALLFAIVRKRPRGLIHQRPGQFAAVCRLLQIALER